MGIDDDAFLLILKMILRLVAKMAKSTMVTLSFNQVEEAIEGDGVRLLVARKSDVVNVAAPRISFNPPNYSGQQR